MPPYETVEEYEGDGDETLPLSTPGTSVQM